MTNKETASLSVKILALYVGVNAVVSSSLETIPYVEQQFYIATQGVNNAVDYASISNILSRQIFSLVIPLIIAVILWRFARWLGTRMVRDSKETTTKQPLTAIELQTILLSVVGLFIMISALPLFITFFIALSLPSIPGVNFSAVILQLVNPLLYLLVGGILLFNAGRFTHHLQKK